MKKAKLIFFKGADNKWRWSLVAANGRKLCCPGESFSSKRKAEDNYARVWGVLKEVGGGNIWLNREYEE